MTDTKKTKILAVAGKGGVGKTSISAAFVRILSEKYPDKKILAIDADPAVGLSGALGFEPELTLDDIRKRIARSISDGNTREAVELLNEAKFHMLDAVTERGNISFIAIGRPESAGCYCKVNAYLKEVIEMISENYDFVVIDSEAGIEQINRRVMEKISCLVLVSDRSKRGINVINTVKEVADSIMTYEKCGVIFNRVPIDFVCDNPVKGAEVLSLIGDDGEQSENDMFGKTVFELNENSLMYKGVYNAYEKLYN